MKEIVRMNGLVRWLLAGLCCLATVGAWADESGGQGGADDVVVVQDETRTQELVVPSRRQPSALGAADAPQGVTPGIESLLQLPRGFVATAPQAVAGVSEADWRRRFKTASSALSEARTALAATKLELDGVAVGGSANQWSVAPPGGGGVGGGGGLGGAGASAATSPLSFRLRQQLRGDRERIDSTEKAYRSLRIEADLAGVPDSWRAQPE